MTKYIRLLFPVVLVIISLSVIIFLFLNVSLFEEEFGAERTGNFETIENRQTAENEHLESSEDELTSSLVESLTERVSGEIGDSIVQMKDEKGDPLQEGYYGGGPFYEYGDVIFFTGPDSDVIVAMSFSGADLTEIEKNELEKLRRSEPIFEGDNEMDEFWIEIYEVDQLEVMIESFEGNGEVQFVWVTEKGLFSK